MLVRFIYFGQWLVRNHIPVLPKLMNWCVRYVFNCDMSVRTSIGGGLRMPHNGLGVVVHPNVIIGNDVTIRQNVTIGGSNGSGVPIIKDNVIIGAGAVLLGDIVIGESARIGANAVVLTDVPPRHTAVGVPATRIFPNK